MDFLGDITENFFLMKRRELTLVLLVFLIGIFFRIYRIRSVPPGLHGDEAQTGLEAIKILDGIPYSPYSSEVYGQTTFHFYLTSFIFRIFGISPVSIRLTSVIVGLLTTPVFYFFIRSVFGVNVALFSAFFLAISRWHTHLSRLGFMTIHITLFQSLTFWFLLKGLRGRKLFDFTLAGIFLGIGLNTYMGFRLIPLIVLFWLIFLFLYQRKSLTGLGLKILCFWLALIVTAAPLLFYAIHNWEMFNGRMRSIWVFENQNQRQAIEQIWQNTKAAILMFNLRGSTWPHKNLPGAPMLDVITGVFFLTGFLIALLKLRESRYSLLLINLFIMLGASIFTKGTYPPSGDPIRSSGALISSVIFAGVGINYLWVFLRAKAKYFIPLILIASFFLNYQAYFIEFANHPAVWHDFHFIPVEIAKLANERENEYIYLLSDWFYLDYLSIRFIAPDLDGEDFFQQLWQYSPKDYLLPLNKHLDKDALFVILPFYNDYLSKLRTFYPEGILKEHYAGPGKKSIFVSFFIPSPFLEGGRGEIN
jgi:4-amino-4-deoxy-L-arabinose transferase-like glycosyltransferase